MGYKGSKHVVWQLNIGAKSMGRVQSATLHLLCLREKEIQVFKPQDYWSVWVEYQEGFKAFYRAKLNPTTSTADPTTDRTTETSPDDAKDGTEKQESDRVTTQAEADRLVAIARSTPHQVVSVEGKTTQQAPPPPFITSTLQQAAGAKLKFSPDQTMKVAQTLYEAGYITYMRTDSVMLAEPFCAAVREYLTRHDPTNVPGKTTRHRAIKGAQEAHEAIRPTDINRLPDQLKTQLSADATRLYELIWLRAIASQCCPARLRKTRVITRSGDVHWEAKGQVVEFPGYTRYWNNLSADTQLPTLQPKQSLQLNQAGADQKQTQPPPRYTEPKLVQLMERRGIGRPSTYAPTIKTLKERGYVQVAQGKLQPTQLGMDLDGALEKLLPDLIQPEFTAQMEAALDQIAHGKQEWQTYLTGWHQSYFAPALTKARQLLSSYECQSVKQTTYQSNKQTDQQLVDQQLDSHTSHHSGKRSGKRSGSKSKVSQSSKSNTIKTAFPCPKCNAAMTQVPSKSKKLKADHFLKCTAVGCGTVMFWQPQGQRYELPYAQRTPDPTSFTDFPCPVCGALLERYHYTKEGQEKEMLRCSLLENRRGKCKDVAFFASRDEFWSPKFGTLPRSQT